MFCVIIDIKFNTLAFSTKIAFLRNEAILQKLMLKLCKKIFLIYLLLTIF